MVKKITYSKEFLEKMEKTLLSEKQNLERELSKFTKRSTHVTGDFDATFPNYGDKEDENAMEVAQYTTNKPLEISLENSLRDTNKALERMKDGSYGLCKYCKEPIEEKRLEARPTSSACINCKKSLTDEI